MSLRIEIENKYKEALKSKNLDLVNAIRLIKSAIKDKDIENRKNDSEKGIGDNEILSLLQNLIKQRKDSIELYKKASRDDLIKKEQFEIDLINSFLPKQLNEEDTDKIIKSIIEEKNLSSLKDMGTLMSILKDNYAGSIDMALAGKIAKSILGN